VHIKMVANSRTIEKAVVCLVTDIIGLNLFVVLFCGKVTENL
jgi:hypothetical protein